MKLKEKEIIEYFYRKRRRDARYKTLVFCLSILAAYLAGILTHQIGGF